MSLIAVYIPCKDDDEARKIAKNLLKERLVACAGMWPIRSLYMWQGEMQDEGEVVIFAKSTAEKYEEIKQKVNEWHSYDVPAIVKVTIEANAEYEKWLRNEVTNG